jgi:hypothetical protein
LARKKQSKKPKRSSAFLPLYRDYPFLRGQMHSDHPFACAFALGAWEERDIISDLGVVFAREVNGAWALLEVTGTRVDSITGYYFEVLSQEDLKLSGVESIREAIAARWPNRPIQELSEEEGVERVRVMIGTSKGPGQLDPDLRECLRIVDRNLLPDPGLQKKYWVLFHRGQDQEIGFDYVRQGLSKNIDQHWENEALNRWVTWENWSAFWMSLLEIGVQWVKEKGLNSLDGPARFVHARHAMIRSCLVILADQTMEPHLRDVSLADLWFATESPSKLEFNEDSGRIFNNVVSLLQKLVEFVDARVEPAVEPTPPKFILEYQLLLAQLSEEERTGVPEGQSILLDMLHTDLGYRYEAQKGSRIRPGLVLPIFSFYLFILSYVNRFEGSRSEAIAALPTDVPDAEAKRALIDKALDAIAETDYSLTPVHDQEMLQERFRNWWRHGRLSPGMAALVGMKPEPIPVPSAEEEDAELEQPEEAERLEPESE